jgi:hypothetical protein
MCLRKRRFRAKGSSKMRDGLVPLSLREQYPTKGVMSFRTIRQQPQNFFKRRACSGKIAALQITHSRPVLGVRLCSRVSLRWCGRLRRQRTMRKYAEIDDESYGQGQVFI